MRKGQSSSRTPIPVTRALRKLGHDIRDARRRRRIPVALMAERASISRTTLNKVEKGIPGVSLGAYATVLFSLGMVDRLADVADPRYDILGRELEEEHLPKRIRLTRPKSTDKPKAADTR
jgi:transcriptional regulator with XRE-family HTH domain